MPFKNTDTSITDRLDWDAWYQKQADTFGRIEHKREQRDRFESVRIDIGLKSFRRKNKMTQIEMADIMGVSRRTYIDYEHCERSVSSLALSLLLVKFDCDLNVLFTQKPFPPSPEQAGKYAQQAEAVLMELRTRFTNLSDDEMWKVAGAFIADRNDPRSWHEREIADFVEELQTPPKRIEQPCERQKTKLAE